MHLKELYDFVMSYIAIQQNYKIFFVIHVLLIVLSNFFFTNFNKFI